MTGSQCQNKFFKIPSLLLFSYASNSFNDFSLIMLVSDKSQLNEFLTSAEFFSTKKCTKFTVFFENYFNYFQAVSTKQLAAAASETLSLKFTSKI